MHHNIFMERLITITLPVVRVTVLQSVIPINAGPQLMIR